MDRAKLKELCRMRLPPTINNHGRDRKSQLLSLSPLLLFALWESKGRTAMGREAENAERDLALKAG